MRRFLLILALAATVSCRAQNQSLDSEVKNSPNAAQDVSKVSVACGKLGGGHYELYAVYNGYKLVMDRLGLEDKRVYYRKGQSDEVVFESIELSAAGSVEMTYIRGDRVTRPIIKVDGANGSGNHISIVFTPDREGGSPNVRPGRAEVTLDGRSLSYQDCIDGFDY